MSETEEATREGQPIVRVSRRRERIEQRRAERRQREAEDSLVAAAEEADAEPAAEPEPEPEPEPAEPVVEDEPQPVPEGTHELRTLDDVAQRAAARAQGRGEPPLQHPSAASTGRPRAWTPDDEVPSDAEDPRQRPEPTYTEAPEEPEEPPPRNPTQVTDRAGRLPPRTVEDLCREYPIGGTTGHYIHVERLKPKTYRAQAVAGYMGQIVDRTTTGEFEECFGGEEYSLQVFGPDPAGRADRMTGQVQIKPLTKPIILKFSGAPVMRPSARFLKGYQMERESSRYGSGRYRDDRYWRREPPTTAEAAIERDALTFARKTLEDEREERKHYQRELETKANAPPDTSIASLLVGASKEQIRLISDRIADKDDALRREREEHRAELAEVRRELEASRSAPSESSHAWGAMRDIATSLGGSGRTSSEDLNRIHESHRAELQRLETSHKSELDQFRSLHDNDLQRERGRADDIKRVHAEELRDREARSTEKERSLRDDADRRERQMEDRYKEKIEALRKDHERELAAQERAHKLVLEARDASHKTEIAVKETLLHQAEKEAERARAEADNKEDLEGQLTKIQTTASLLGYSKSEESKGPTTWQERLADSAGKALMNIDKTMKAAGETLRERNEGMRLQLAAADRAAHPQRHAQQQQRATAPPQRQIRGPGGQAVAARRTAWATEDFTVEDDAPMGRSVQAGASGGPDPDERPRPQQPEPEPEPPEPPQEPEPEPPPQRPVHEAAPSNGATQQVQFDPEELEQFRLRAEHEIDRGTTPVEFAQDLREQVGIAGVRSMFASGVTPESVIAALAATPNMQGSSILRPDGRRFLRQAWQELRAILTRYDAEREQRPAES